MAKSRSPKSASKSRALSKRWARIKEQARQVKGSFRARYETRRVDHDIADESDLIDVKLELTFEFEGTYSRQVIELAARSLGKFEWVMRGHPRRGHLAPAGPSRDPRPRLGHARELHARAELGARLESLRAALRGYKEVLGPIGSNDTNGVLELDADIPPPPYAIELALSVLEQQLASNSPARADVREAKRRIRAWSGTWRWFREKADRAANSVVDQVGPIIKWGIVSLALLQGGDRLAESAQRTHEVAESWEQCVFETDPQHRAPSWAHLDYDDRHGQPQSGIPPPYDRKRTGS